MTNQISQLYTWTLTRFFESGVPFPLSPGPRGGVTATTDYGREITFRDRASVDYFLLGYSLGRSAEPLTVPETDAVPPSLGEPPDEGTE